MSRDHWIWDALLSVAAFSLMLYFSFQWPGFGMLLSLFLMLIWYWWIGQKFLERFIDLIFRSAEGTVSMKEMLEAEVIHLLKNKEYDMAITKSCEWIRSEPGRAKPILRLVQILVDHKGKTPAAIFELELAVVRPLNAEDQVAIALRLAELYRRCGKEEKIANMFDRVRQFHPKSPHIQQLVL